MENDGMHEAGKRLMPQGKTIRDYIGWIGAALIACLLLRDVVMHGQELWYYIFGANSMIFSMFSDPQFSLLNRFTTVTGIAFSVLFFFYPLLLLILITLRKRIVPTLLVVYAIAALVFIAAGQVEAILLAAQYSSPVPVMWKAYVLLAVDVLVLLFCLKSKKLRAIFIK